MDIFSAQMYLRSVMNVHVRLTFIVLHKESIMKFVIAYEKEEFPNIFFNPKDVFYMKFYMCYVHLQSFILEEKNKFQIGRNTKSKFHNPIPPHFSLIYR